MAQFFSYFPRSGSRILAAYPAPAIVICDIVVGTIAAGDGVTLSYPAAEPGRWWRGEAGDMASQIVQRVGGLAEDDRGTVSLFVPREHAARAHDLMAGIAPRPEYGGAFPATSDAAWGPQLRALWRAEAAILTADLSWALAAPAPYVDASGFGWWYRGEAGEWRFSGTGQGADGCGPSGKPRRSYLRPDGQLKYEDAEYTQARFTICPVALPPKQVDGEWQEGRIALRVGLLTDENDEGDAYWVRTFAEVHRHGRLPLSVKAGHNTRVYHHDSGQYGQLYSWPADLRVDQNGDLLPASDPLPDDAVITVGLAWRFLASRLRDGGFGRLNVESLADSYFPGRESITAGELRASIDGFGCGEARRLAQLLLDHGGDLGGAAHPAMAGAGEAE